MSDDIVLDCIHFRRVDGQWWDCDEGSEPYLLVMTGAMVAALDEIERLRAENERLNIVTDEQVMLIEHQEAEIERLRTVIGQAQHELAMEHRPDPELRGRGGCVICWPHDGSWPCASAMICDDLKKATDD